MTMKDDAMSYKHKIGKGVVNRVGWQNSISFPLTVQVNNKMGDLTLKQIAKQLGKQAEIQDGYIQIIEITFRYGKRGKKIESDD